MKPRPLTSGQRLALSIALAVLSTAVLIFVFQRQAEVQNEPQKLTTVLVAKAYIPAQTPLEAKLFQSKRVPELFLPPRIIGLKELGDSTSPRFRARGDILKGEILNQPRVMDVNRAGVAWTLGEHETALTMQLGPDAAMHGLAASGDTVRLVSVAEGRACVLVSRARVLATEESLVSLALSERDALRVRLAADKTSVSLLLLSPLDNSAPPKCVTGKDL